MKANLYKRLERLEGKSEQQECRVFHADLKTGVIPDEFRPDVDCLIIRQIIGADRKPTTDNPRYTWRGKPFDTECEVDRA